MDEGLDFILTNAVKYNVDHETLERELNQLGLPKVSLFKAY